MGSRCPSDWVLRQLPTSLQLHIMSFLPPNDRALSGRQVSPDAADNLSEPQHCTVSLSQQLPPHALPWAVAAGQQHVRQLTFRRKLCLLCTAAASGSEVNLEVAWALLQPSIWPELLQRPNSWSEHNSFSDVGVAAVTAGQPQVLDWLLRHCPALLRPDRTLAAAAKHCSLAGLQATWSALQRADCHGCHLPRVELDQTVLNAAAESADTQDAVEKMEWLLAAGAGECCLKESTARAAACAGDMRRLQWLQGKGCPFSNGTHSVDMGSWVQDAFPVVLERADLGLMQWLVDEAGCRLPQEGGHDGRSWLPLFEAAAKSTDGAAKLAWLQERGAPSLAALRDRDAGRALRGLISIAVTAGQVAAVRYLLSLYSPGAGQLGSWAAAAGEAAADGSSGKCMAECLRQAGFQLHASAFTACARSGNLATVRWLALEAGVSAAGVGVCEVIGAWPKRTAADSRGLLEAVQLLVVRAGCGGGELSSALAYAAERGHVRLLQYLLEQHPAERPNRETVVAAAMGGCEALLEWLVEQHPGCVAGSAYACPYHVAAKQGDRCTLAALRRLGVPWGSGWNVVRAIVACCPMPAVRWMAEHGLPVGPRFAIESIVENRADWYDAETAAWMRSLPAAAEG